MIHLDVYDAARGRGRCDFHSPQEAAALWHAAYPHEEPDPYLADYIQQITQQ